MTLRRYHADTKTVDLALTIPSDAVGGGALVISGGAGGFGGPCSFGPCGHTFQKLLDILAGAHMNNDLFAELDLFGGSGAPHTAAQDTKHLGATVSGNRQISVNIIP